MMPKFDTDSPSSSQRGIANPSHHRKGFVLPLVFGTMTVLTLFFAIMSFLSSGQTQAASHFLDSARSLSIAKAGAEWAVSAFASGTYDPEVSLALVKDQAFWDLLCGDSEDDEEGEFFIANPDPEEKNALPGELKEYVYKELGGKLEVKVRVYGIKHFPIEGLEGFKENLIEKSGKMEFSAIGTVGKASRRVCIRKGFKVVMIVHPVLSKFTLFVRDKKSGEDVNILDRKTGSPGFANGTPLVLNNQGEGKAFPALGASGKFLDSVHELKTESGLMGLPALVRKSGWVFLNSPNDKDWTLNLSGSGADSEFDDRILVRVGEYRRKDLEARLDMTERANKEQIIQIREKFEGLKSDYRTLFAGKPVIMDTSDVLSLKYYYPDPKITPKTSLIRPFGKGSQLSPTLVFGPVYMRYLSLRSMDALMGQSTCLDVIIPGFWNQQEFEAAFKPPSPPLPPNVADNMGNFARFMGFQRSSPNTKDFENYQLVSTKVTEAPFLTALDFIYLESHEIGPFDKPTGLEYPNPPPNIIRDGVAGELLPWGGDRKSVVDAKGTFGTKDTILFDGKLVDIDGCKELQSKVTAVFPSFDELKKSYLEKGALRLPGIVYVKDDLILDEPLTITCPGVIICGGNVTIKSGVDSKHSLTIASLKNINIDTSDVIRAHLICRGKFTATCGFTIIGGVAAGSLDLTGLGSISGPKTIIFEPDHDPFSKIEEGIPLEFYRYYLSAEEEYIVEGGKK